MVLLRSCAVRFCGPIMSVYFKQTLCLCNAALLRESMWLNKTNFKKWYKKSEMYWCNGIVFLCIRIISKTIRFCRYMYIYEWIFHVLEKSDLFHFKHFFCSEQMVCSHSFVAVVSSFNYMKILFTIWLYIYA